MNRREFLGWLTATGAALALPIQAMPIRADERSLFDFSDWRVAGDREGYRIPVRIKGLRPWKVHEIVGTVIDRPVFGIAPRSIRVTRFRCDAENGATAELFIDRMNIGHAHEIKVLDDAGLHVFQCWRLSKCDDVEFVPFVERA